MKKITLLFVFIVANIAVSSALTRTSVSNGAWTNPAIWSPAGVPTPADDTIIINTTVQYSQNIQFGLSMFHITNNGTLLDMGVDTITFGGDFMLVEGYFSAAMIIMGANDSVVNYDYIDVTEISQSSLLINHANAAICASLQLITSDNVINNGDMSCGMWVNGANVTGNGGQFCISGNFINTDQISGTIDICDASPGGFGDVNAGTIAGSVTNCQAGPCTQCMLASIGEYGNESSVKIVPHPVSGVSLLEFNGLNANGASHQLIITDVTGRLVTTQAFTGNQVYLDRTGIGSGVYFYHVMDRNNTVVSGKLVIQ